MTTAPKSALANRPVRPNRIVPGSAADGRLRPRGHEPPHRPTGRQCKQRFSSRQSRAVRATSAHRHQMQPEPVPLRTGSLLSGRSGGDPGHQRKHVPLTVLEERHPLLGPGRVVAEDHVRRGREPDAASLELAARAAVMSGTRKYSTDEGRHSFSGFAWI